MIFMVVIIVEPKEEKRKKNAKGNINQNVNEKKEKKFQPNESSLIFIFLSELLIIS